MTAACPRSCERCRLPGWFLRLQGDVVLAHQVADNSKLGIQEGKRGRGAPKLKTLKKMGQQAKRKVIQKAKRRKADPQPDPVRAR